MTDHSGNTGAEPPKVQNLAGLVAYQEGAIVSRMLIKKTAGTVTIFAFDRGQSLSEHSTPYDALVYVLDGRTEITIDGHPHVLGSGETIVMPGNVPHAVRAVEPFKMVLTMIKSS